MISLKCLKIHNIFSIKKATIRFFVNPGLYLICGVRNGNGSNSNGVGKSSILKVINWLLFDATTENIMVKDIVRKGAGKGYAKLIFDCNRKRYEVIKKRNRLGGRVQLLENGKDISYKDSSTTIKYIQKILGMSFDLWSNTVVIGQGRSGVLFDGTDKDRKDLFVRLLRLEALDKSLRYIRDKLKLYRNKLEYNRGKLSGLKPIDTRNINETDLKRKIKIFNRRVVIIKEKLKEYNAKYSVSRSKWNALEVEISRMRDETHKLESSRNKGVCPFCKRPMSDLTLIEERLAEISNEYTPKRKELDKILKVCEDTRHSLNLFDDKHTEYEKKCSRYRASLSSNREADRHNVKIERIRDKCVEHVKILEDSITIYSKLEDIFGVNGYRKYLISTILDRITLAMNNMIHGILDVKVKFFLEGIKFDIRIERNGSELEKRSLSGGEQKLLSIVFNLAVVSVLVGKNMNCLFYDEILSQIDETNSLNITGILNGLAKQMGLSIYLITNQKHLVEQSTDNVCGKIVVSMNRRGVSTIKQETA